MKTKKKKKYQSFQARKNRAYAKFLIPFLIGFFGLFLGIYINSLRFSFCSLEMKGIEGYDLHFVGWENYRFALLTDPKYVGNVTSSLSQMLALIPMVILYSLLMAVILNRNLKGRGFFRAVFFIPVILATGFVNKADAYASVFTQQWQSISGGAETATTLANGLVSTMQIKEFISNLSFSPALTKYVVSAVDSIFNIVNVSGVQMMIFLAGLQSISPNIYEASDIDGATGWEKFWLITFPMISPMISVNVIYTIVDILTQPSNVIMQQIQQTSFNSNSMGVASAMAWMYFLVMAVSMGIIYFIISRYVYYQRKE